MWQARVPTGDEKTSFPCVNFAARLVSRALERSGLRVSAPPDSGGPQPIDPPVLDPPAQPGARRPRVRKVSLRVRLASFAAFAMTLVIAERTISVFRLHADNLVAAERHVTELLDRGVGHYGEMLATVRAVLLTLASDTRTLPPDIAAAGKLPPAGQVPGASAEPDPALTPDNPEACVPLSRVDEAFPAIESLTIVGPNGIVRCGTAPGSAGLDLSARDYVRIALRGISNVEPVLRSYLTDRPTLYAAQPITAAEGGGVLGVIVARIGLGELFPRGTLAELGVGTQVLLVSPAGTVMMTYPEDILRQGLDLSSTAPVARAMSHTRGTILAKGPDGVQRVYAYDRLPRTNMHLLVGVDQTVLMGPVERATWSAGFTMLAVGLILLTGLWIAGETLVVAPVQALADRLVRFGRGEKETPKSNVVIAELQPLVVAFEAMADELTRRETALRSANQRLNSLASLDGLTGIANRRSFDAVFALRWGSVPRLAILILDIDNFKKFNDFYGHKEGDGCLRTIAQMLAATVRGTDMVARIGGEEFAVLMPGAELGTAADVAERLRRAVEQLAIPHAAVPLGHVTVSIGCAACRPRLDLSPSDLFVAADTALYAAKRAGRNRVGRADDPLADGPDGGRPEGPGGAAG